MTGPSPDLPHSPSIPAATPGPSESFSTKIQMTAPARIVAPEQRPADRIEHDLHQQLHYQNSSYSRIFHRGYKPI